MIAYRALERQGRASGTFGPTNITGVSPNARPVRASIMALRAATIILQIHYTTNGTAAVDTRKWDHSPRAAKQITSPAWPCSGFVIRRRSNAEVKAVAEIRQDTIITRPGSHVPYEDMTYTAFTGRHAESL